MITIYAYLDLDQDHFYICHGQGGIGKIENILDNPK